MPGSFADEHFAEISKKEGECELVVMGQKEKFPYKATNFINDAGTIAYSIIETTGKEGTKRTSYAFLSKLANEDAFTLSSSSNGKIPYKGMRVSMVSEECSLEEIYDEHVKNIGSDSPIADRAYLEKEVEGIPQKGVDIAATAINSIMQAFQGLGDMMSKMMGAPDGAGKEEGTAAKDATPKEPIGAMFSMMFQGIKEGFESINSEVKEVHDEEKNKVDAKEDEAPSSEMPAEQKAETLKEEPMKEEPMKEELKKEEPKPKVRKPDSELKMPLLVVGEGEHPHWGARVSSGMYNKRLVCTYCGGMPDVIKVASADGMSLYEWTMCASDEGQGNITKDKIGLANENYTLVMRRCEDAEVGKQYAGHDMMKKKLDEVGPSEPRDNDECALFGELLASNENREEFIFAIANDKKAQMSRRVAAIKLLNQGYDSGPRWRWDPKCKFPQELVDKMKDVDAGIAKEMTYDNVAANQAEARALAVLLGSEEPEIVAAASMQFETMSDYRPWCWLDDETLEKIEEAAMHAIGVVAREAKNGNKMEMKVASRVSFLFARTGVRDVARFEKVMLELRENYPCKDEYEANNIVEILIRGYEAARYPEGPNKLLEMLAKTDVRDRVRSQLIHSLAATMHPDAYAWLASRAGTPDESDASGKFYDILSYGDFPKESALPEEWEAWWTARVKEKWTPLGAMFAKGYWSQTIAMAFWRATGIRIPWENPQRDYEWKKERYAEAKRIYDDWASAGKLPISRSQKDVAKEIPNAFERKFVSRDHVHPAIHEKIASLVSRVTPQMLARALAAATRDARARSFVVSYTAGKYLGNRPHNCWFERSNEEEANSCYYETRSNDVSSSLGVYLFYDTKMRGVIDDENLEKFKVNHVAWKWRKEAGMYGVNTPIQFIAWDIEDYLYNYEPKLEVKIEDFRQLRLVVGYLMSGWDWITYYWQFDRFKMKVLCGEDGMPGTRGFRLIDGAKPNDAERMLRAMGYLIVTALQARDENCMENYLSENAVGANEEDIAKWYKEPVFPPPALFIDSDEIESALDAHSNRQPERPPKEAKKEKPALPVVVPPRGEPSFYVPKINEAIIRYVKALDDNEVTLEVVSRLESLAKFPRPRPSSRCPQYTYFREACSRIYDAVAHKLEGSSSIVDDLKYIFFQREPGDCGSISLQLYQNQLDQMIEDEGLDEDDIEYKFNEERETELDELVMKIALIRAHCPLYNVYGSSDLIALMPGKPGAPWPVYHEHVEGLWRVADDLVEFLEQKLDMHSI